MQDIGVPYEVLQERAEALRNEGQTVMFLAVDGRFAGLLAVADPIKASSFRAIHQLKKDGLTVVMVMGDNHTTAAAAASKLGIDFEVDVPPERKVDVVRSLKARGKIVAMAGDGVRDGCSNCRWRNRPCRRQFAWNRQGAKVSQKTMGNIRQNLFFAFLYNAVGVPVAAGVLYPKFGLLLNPMIAAVAMSFSSVSVIANSLRLRTAKL
jgi:P-type Cu+ transporter